MFLSHLSADCDRELALNRENDQRLKSEAKNEFVRLFCILTALNARRAEIPVLVELRFKIAESDSCSGRDARRDESSRRC